MKLHEYQAKQLFASAGIPIPRGQVAKTPEEAGRAYSALRQPSVNVKAQLHAGGRGKAGGVLVATNAAQAAEQAAKLLGQRLVTKQTGPQGLPVSAVLIDERIEMDAERYLALTIDRFHGRPLVLASVKGGVDIEEVAASEPGAIAREPIDMATGLQPAQVSGLVEALGVPADLVETARGVVKSVWELFVSYDASLIEINPLVVTADGHLLALDAKVIIDDNALFRHPDLAAMRDPTQEHPIEWKALQRGIAYVGLEGTIGCLVNGAGLAMATNDIITLCGGKPANFLDVGGGANVEQVTNAFSIILEDARVKVILVNIFGGIMRCDWIAQGLLNATRSLNVQVPLVVRLQGTNVEEGRRMLAEAKGLNLISVDDLEAATRKAVELAQR
jgi:succinyl-CoA synthetase beta subunit